VYDARLHGLAPLFYFSRFFLRIAEKVCFTMLEIGLITSRIKDMQGRADALRGYL
jgi:hypothetical protein